MVGWGTVDIWNGIWRLEMREFQLRLTGNCQKIEQNKKGKLHKFRVFLYHLQKYRQTFSISINTGSRFSLSKIPSLFFCHSTNTGLLFQAFSGRPSSLEVIAEAPCFVHVSSSFVQSRNSTEGEATRRKSPSKQ